MIITIGQKAPGFSLYDSEKNNVNLDDCRGSNVLLLFFPLAFTSVCTKEFGIVRDNIAVYNEANAKVLGISVDSIYTLAKFKAEHSLNFSLVSDFNKEVSTAYGALYDNFSFGMKGVSKRASFIADKEGIIRYAEVLENAGDLPDFTEIQRVLTTVC